MRSNFLIILVVHHWTPIFQDFLVVMSPKLDLLLHIQKRKWCIKWNNHFFSFWFLFLKSFHPDSQTVFPKVKRQCIFRKLSCFPPPQRQQKILFSCLQASLSRKGPWLVWGLLVWFAVSAVFGIKSIFLGLRRNLLRWSVKRSGYAGFARARQFSQSLPLGPYFFVNQV